MNDFGLLPVSSTRTATIAFLECELRGIWRRKIPMFQEPNWITYISSHKDGAEVWLVRPDGLRRAWKFKEKTAVHLGQSAIRFDHEAIIAEIAVDEDAQVGKKGSPTVV